MGADVDCRAVGQRPDLTAIITRARRIGENGAAGPAMGPAARIIVLTLLTIDGVLSAVGGALFLPSYIGAIPCPISALISGVVNAALVWAAGQCTTSLVLAALPLWAWLAAVFAMCFPGPGGDVIFAGPGMMAYSPFLLIAVGAVPPFWMLWRSRAAA